MPWFLNDPKVVIKFKGEDGKVGATSYWKGNNKVEGIQKIVKGTGGKVAGNRIAVSKTLQISFA